MARKTKDELENVEENITQKKTRKTAATKKTAAKSVSTKEPTSKKAAATKKATTTTKKSTATKKPTTTKQTATKKAATTSKKTTIKKTTTSRKKSSTPKADAEIIQLKQPEYYDLPYRYNDTVVKVLAQEPNTLFVYWDISDKDRENFEKLYGKLFFYNTRPVLIVHNLTDNYSFEVDIDDFANNWYVHVNDSKCQYSVELGRRPKYDKHESVPLTYLNVAFSNTVEIPNDHILYFRDNDKIYFKNIKTNHVTEKVINIKSDYNRVRSIYKNYNISDNSDRFDFNNPSSQNPTSTFL